MTNTVSTSTLWEELSSDAPNEQTERLQQLAGGPPGYRLRRVILTNFWLYEHQEFHIPHGRLFLAGENASGKSTVLMAAIPLALDGDYRPERIDTFGKREKRIDYYILGSNESATPFVRDQRTSYVALEFEWCDTENPPFASELRALWEKGETQKARFLTIGLVFAGNRNNMQPVSATRFLITDGSRLEHDIPTYHETREGRRAYDLKSFRKTIAEHGIVCDTIREYEQKVSQYLFNFTNVNDFRRLIRQLLYLRQPNLNSVISLETVRTFLDQSLPQIPDDMLQNAAKTLEIMDNLQDEIGRRKRAYNAVEKLHHAQQALTIARVQLAACDYIHEQFKENEAQADIQKLRRQLTRAENDLVRWRDKITELELEQTQLTGKLSALEGSEGLQAIHRLNQVNERVSALEKSLTEQQVIFDDTVQRREQNAQNTEQQAKEFHSSHEQSTTLLQNMHHTAQQSAYWELASEQLARLWEQLKTITLSSETPNISTTLSIFTETTVQERLNWLRTLQQLHQSIERETARLQTIQQQEAHLYEEVDDVTRKFDSDREQFNLAQQTLANDLDQLIAQHDILYPHYFTPLHEQASELLNDTTTPQETVANSQHILQEYRTLTNRALDTIQGSLNQLQHSLSDLKIRQGAKSLETSQAEQRYQQKLQEPEYIPQRTEHRQRARARLASQGIPALPLYMLIDFIPDIDSQDNLAGGLEHMLENAGLLDALIIPESYSSVADALLTGEGLSDCRLTVTATDDTPHTHTTRWFRLDPALPELVANNQALWEHTIHQAIHSIEQTLQATSSTWQHGLLTGTIGEGRARYIGQANRVREQRQEQAHLRQIWEQLNSELDNINTHIAETEQQQHALTAGREQLRLIIKDSPIETHYITLQATLNTLIKAQERYQKIRIETQTLRQSIQNLRANLHRAVNGMDIFINDITKIDQAYESTRTLHNYYQTLQSHLQQLIRSWQGYKRSDSMHQDAKAAEFRAAQALKRIEQQTEQARSELATLRQVIREREGESIEDIFNQLREMRDRLDNTLPGEIDHARESHTRVDTNLVNLQESYQKAQLTLESVQHLRQNAGDTLLQTLDIYPVETLQIARQALHTQLDLETAQRLLHEPLSQDDEAYHITRTALDTNRNTTYNALFQVYSEVINLLHEYGTSYDDQGTIRFTNADHATPIELLTRLAEEIAQQERLLDERERTLFQDFLLKEMADTVRKHILDAEEWIDRMNKILGHTAFVEENYYLQWVSKDPEQLQTGNYLAQYHHLLRRQAQTLKDEEIEALIHAFRQEIMALRSNTQSHMELPFAQALAQIFDYRRWFKFEIFVKKVDGTRQHLTDRFLKKRSGAEQYIALYVPFFAALSALYESAGNGAPRLIALDEAFDKVSVANTQRLLKFLASQHFQWIMSGPRVSGEGTEIPACVRYVMLHRKGSELATGFPSFWNGKQSNNAKR